VGGYENSTQSSHSTKYHHVFLSLDAHISNQQQQQQRQHPMTQHQSGGYQQQEQTLPLVVFRFHTPWFLRIKDPVPICNHMKNTSNDCL
jgi:hypothetical protein